MQPRPATAADAAEFVRLKAEIMTHHYPFPVDLGSEAGWAERAQEVFVTLIGRPDYAQFVIADPEREGRLLGAVSVHVERFLPGPGWPARQAYIGDMCVDPAARGRGLGRDLMDAALAWCREQGVESAYLDATPSAVPAYAALGFVARPEPAPFPRMRIALEPASGAEADGT